MCVCTMIWNLQDRKEQNSQITRLNKADMDYLDRKVTALKLERQHPVSTEAFG